MRSVSGCGFYFKFANDHRCKTIVAARQQAISNSSLEIY